jgi:GT2 family glycosyltransferase
MHASIVIASHNEGRLLRRTVQSCVETTDGLDHEIVIADDASGDGSVEELLRHYPDVRVVKSRRRLGCSPTKDAAARWARGKVLVFLDAHCNPEHGAITRLVSDVEELRGIAIVTPSVPVLNVKRWQNNMNCIAFGFSFNLETFEGKWMALEDMAAFSDSKRLRLYVSPSLVGCCFAMSRKLYTKLRGFDADMRCWGIEDVDLALKAWLMGYPVLHDPAAVIGHRFVRKFAYTVPQEHVTANMLRMARKNFTDPVWEDFLRRAKKREPDWPWDKAWRLFTCRRASLECERSYLMRHRVRDEFWYAREFGLKWPTVAESARTRTSKARRRNRALR